MGAMTRSPNRTWAALAVVTAIVVVLVWLLPPVGLKSEEHTSELQSH